MAHLHVFVTRRAFLLVVGLLAPVCSIITQRIVLAASDPQPVTRGTASFETTAVGNVAYETLRVESSNGPVAYSQRVAVRKSSAYCFYSRWHMIWVNSVSFERKYGVHIYNACDGDRQIFPAAADPRVGPCNNDDSLHASSRYSICPVFQAHHVPAGLAPHECDALAVASTSLDATLTPDTYDPHLPTLLTASTSFASNLAERLSDGTCLANLDWRDTAWSMRWSDGATDARPGSGQQGITDAHLLAPQPAAGDATRTADVTAVATLHLTGDAVDFDDAGAPTVVHRTADVQISNHRTSTGLLPGAVYTPPSLAVAAVPVGQKGDGTIPPPDPRQPPLTHADTIRGRLLELFPRALVLRPGTETVGGTTVGEATSEVVGWTYLGSPTDAPSREATVPGTAALPDRPVAVQWNHAQRLDGQRRPVDEEVPLRLTVRTTYPDGHAEDQTITGAIAVSIYYVGLMDPG